jgi:GAF domain-containing protein
LDIPFDLGICGAAARTATTQDVPNVHVRPEHIACSSSTNSEVVVPVIAPSGQVIAVLDVDSDDLAAFEANDVALLEAVCKDLGQRYGETVVAHIPGLA